MNSEGLIFLGTEPRGLWARDYQAADFYKLRLRDEERQSLGEYTNLMDRVLNLSYLGPCMSLLTEDAKLVTVVGVKRHGNGLGEVWQIPNDGMPHKHVKNYLAAMTDLCGLAYGAFEFKKLFTWCDNDKAHAHWMEYMGFSRMPAEHSKWGRKVVLYEKVVGNGRS